MEVCWHVSRLETIQLDTTANSHIRHTKRLAIEHLQCCFRRHGYKISIVVKSRAVLFQDIVDRTRKRCQKPQIVDQILWHGVIGCDQRNIHLLGAADSCAPDAHWRLNVDNIRAEILDNSLYFPVRRNRNSKILVERKNDRAGAHHAMVTIDFFIFFTCL